MRSHLNRLTTLLFFLAFLSAPLAYGQHEQTHIPLDAEAATLKEAFNKDIGTVRVVLLLSPT